MPGDTKVTPDTPAPVAISGLLNFTSFSPGEITWTRWVNKFNGALKLANVKDEDKHQYLLQYIGDKAYNALCDTYGDDEIYNKDFTTLSAKMKELFEPPILEIAENFKFNCRKQLPGETNQEFATALQKLSAHCGFGAHSQKALRNQFVYGVSSKRVQSRLIETKDLTFGTAVTLAVSMETCERETSGFQDTAAPVNYVNSLKKRPNKPKWPVQSPTTVQSTVDRSKPHCFCCGDANHKANQCTLPKNTMCNMCRKKGHLAKVCRSSNTRNIHDVDAEDEEFTYGVELADIYEVDISEINSVAVRDKFMKTFDVNGKQVEFELDSGAAVSLMWLDEAKKLFPRAILQRSTIKLVTYCKNKIDVRGVINVIVTFENCKFPLDLYITDVDRSPLCGREWLHQFIQCKGAQTVFNSILSVETECLANFDKIAFTNLLSQKYKNVVRQDFSPITALQRWDLHL